MCQVQARLSQYLASPGPMAISAGPVDREQTLGQLAGALRVSMVEIGQHLSELCQGGLELGEDGQTTPRYRLRNGGLHETMAGRPTRVQPALPDTPPAIVSRADKKTGKNDNTALVSTFCRAHREPDRIDRA